MSRSVTVRNAQVTLPALHPKKIKHVAIVSRESPNARM
jgi:hypothetical protein